MKKVLFLVFSLLIIYPTVIFAQNRQVNVTFSKCVDGDTAKFMLQNEEITVRFLAIDTPETKHPKKKEEPYGKEASDFTCKAIQNAKTIILEYDSDSDLYDKYNRHLAWVYVDDILLQDALIQNGLAKVAYLYGDYAYTSLLQEHEAIAKEKQIGIWSDENPKKVNYWYIVIIIAFIIFIYIIYPKGRKKINRKIKSKMKRELKKRIL